MSYKRKVSELEKSRRLLRSQYQKAQERVLAKDREIDTILQKVAGGAALITEKSMIRTLKQQVRTLQDTISEKSGEIERLRSTVKFTQLEEMRIYCDDFAQELRRLRLFNELGRTAETHVTIPVLEEIRTLRQECGALRRDNADLANRLTQTELNAEQSRARDRKQFAERIQKMEGELRQERALVAEMETIGDLTRAELAQVVAQTDTTRVALADSSAQIRLLRDRVAAQEAELQLQKVTAATAEEKAGNDLADLRALKESMEKKLLSELGALHEINERQRTVNAALQESERLLQGTVIDLKRVCDETKRKAHEDQQELVRKLQQNETQMDAIEVEKKSVQADLISVRADLEHSATALHQSQQSYERAKADLFALEKELQKVVAEAEQAAAARTAEIVQQEAEIQVQQLEVARLRALHEEAATKFRADLNEPILQPDVTSSAITETPEDPNVIRSESPNDEAAKSGDLDDTAAADSAEKAEIPVVNDSVSEPKFEPVPDGQRLGSTSSEDPRPAHDDPAAEIIAAETPPEIANRSEEKDSTKKPKKDRERRSSSEKPEKHSGKTEKSKAQEAPDKEKPDKDKPDRHSNKSEKRSDKKPSTKRGSSKPA